MASTVLKRPASKAGRLESKRAGLTKALKHGSARRREAQRGGASCAKPWLLVTGQPGSGKTTLVREVASALAGRSRLRVRGFITEEVLDSKGARLGFDVVTLPKGQRGILARKGGPAHQPRTGSYSVDVASFEALALPPLERAVAACHPSEVVVIDEIGRMELHSERFQAAVKALLRARCRVFGAITAPIYGHRVAFCDAITAKVGVVSVHRITKGNRDAVRKEVEDRLVGSWG